MSLASMVLNDLSYAKNYTMSADLECITVSVVILVCFHQSINTILSQDGLVFMTLSKLNLIVTMLQGLVIDLLE